MDRSSDPTMRCSASVWRVHAVQVAQAAAEQYRIEQASSRRQ
jgi:hypothetical protein